MHLFFTSIKCFISNHLITLNGFVLFCFALLCFVCFVAVFSLDFCFDLDFIIYFNFLGGVLLKYNNNLYYCNIFKPPFVIIF